MDPIEFLIRSLLRLPMQPGGQHNTPPMVPESKPKYNERPARELTNVPQEAMSWGAGSGAPGFMSHAELYNLPTWTEAVNRARTRIANERGPQAPIETPVMRPTPMGSIGSNLQQAAANQLLENQASRRLASLDTNYGGYVPTQANPQMGLGNLIRPEVQAPPQIPPNFAPGLPQAGPAPGWAVADNIPAPPQPVADPFVKSGPAASPQMADKTFTAPFSAPRQVIAPPPQPLPPVAQPAPNPFQVAQALGGAGVTAPAAGSRVLPGASSLPAAAPAPPPVLRPAMPAPIAPMPGPMAQAPPPAPAAPPPPKLRTVAEDTGPISPDPQLAPQVGVSLPEVVKAALLAQAVQLTARRKAELMPQKPVA